MWNNKLEKIKVRLTDLNGFYSRISSDGIIYIPQDIVKNQKLRQNDVVLIRVIKNNKVIKEKYTKIAVHRKRNKLEYVCVFDKNFYGKELIFQIKKEASEEKVSRINLIIRKILKNFYFTFVNKNLVIVFKGNKVPAVINTNLKYSDVVFYLGAYFADGTRKGNSWAICASTFEQARYYLKMHNFLIKDSRPEFAISYTNIYNIEPVELKKNLVEIWQKEVSIKVNKFRIRKPSGKSISKWNKYGTLVIREHRQILLDFYNALLESLVKEISLKKDKKLAIDFVCGVMEGDGCAPAKKRGHITIATNKEDLDILKNIVKVAQINFKVIQQSNKYTLRIGALEILRNFYLLKDKIFLFYPKRRKALFERLKTVGAIKFLIEDRGSTNWVKVWLRSNGFVDKNYEITKNGLNLSNNLLNEMAKLGV